MQSPRGRFIQYVEGSPDSIIERGEAIKVLGDQMLDSADVLESIKNRALESGGQKGQAIAALRESIGDSYQTLREAGELYQPVGPVISTYGHALDAVQPRIRAAVDDSLDLWDTYISLPGEVEPRGTGGLFQPDEGSPEAEQQAAEDAAKKAAYDAWEARAGDFDAHYDTWEEAFDEAVTGVSDELAGSIKDSFWGDVLAGLVTALEWAALAVGILALVFAGPFVAIALAIGLALLAVTAIQYFRGEATWGDVGFAALGVLPFGKAGLLFQRGGRVAFAGEILKPLSSFGQFGKITAANRLLGGGTGNWFKVAFQNGNRHGAADILGRTFFGKDATGFDNLRTLHLSDVAGSLWDISHSAVGQYLKYDSWTSKFTGHENLKQQVVALDVVW